MNTVSVVSTRSVEMLYVRLGSTPPIGEPHNLPALGAVPEVAFVPHGEVPGENDWHSANWATPAGPYPPPDGPYWFAGVMVGPGHVEIAPGRVDMWARVTYLTQRPEIGPVGTFRVVAPAAP